MRFLIAFLCSLMIAVDAADAPLFFAFDNGLGRGDWPVAQQAATAADLGYGGIGYTGTSGLAERLAACDERRLVIPSLYVACRIDRSPSFEPGLPEALPLMGKRGIILWLNVQGQGDDAAALRAVGEIADLAKPHGVRIAIYPHHGFHLATARQSLAFVERLARPNVGISLTLCHELRAGNHADLSAIIREVAPRCLLVGINGADRAGRDWNSLIRPLGDGDVDVLGVLRDLRDAGFTGAVGLQGYQIPGDPRENLIRSMRTWSSYRTALWR